MSRPREGAIWAGHLLGLLPPLGTLVYLAAGPHGWGVALLPALAVVLLAALDRAGTARHRAPAVTHPVAFDLLLLASAAMHWVNLALLLRAVSRAGGVSVDLVTSVLLVGAGSAYSAVVVGHELVHGRRRWRRWLGRTLLWTALYDHFHVEHLRGHHVRAATAADPATARLGESFWHYLGRSPRGELASAWRLAPRTVAAGALIELGLLAGVLLGFGAAGAGAVVAQALLAQLFITAVNYIEHWGLSGGRRAGAVAWDCDSFVTHFALFGLGRHPAHHTRVAAPYHRLELDEASPRLPAGYLRMVGLVVLHNASAQRQLRAELARKGLVSRPQLTGL